MFKAILRFLGIIKLEPVVPVTELARQEMAFEAYLEYLYGLDICDLYVMTARAVADNNEVRVKFLKKVIAEQDKRIKSKKVSTSRKITDYPETEPLTNQILLMQLYTQQSTNISMEKSETPIESKFSGKGGTFDGGGASGDWDTEYRSRNHIPNPVYHNPEETRHRLDDGFGMTSSSVLSKSRSHTPDPDPVYHNPPQTYSAPPSYDPPPPSYGGSSGSDSSGGGSCDGGGGSSPSCD